MRKFFSLLAFLLLASNLAYAWTSETGSGVVSANENIVRASLEATQVLQSDTLTNLYGVTILGGASNYASFNSGGILDFRNVVASKDVQLIDNDNYSAYLTSLGALVRVGVSADNIFVIGANSRILGRVSADGVNVASLFSTSINTTRINVSGNSTITSAYSTGTCSFTFNNGLLTSASC